MNYEFIFQSQKEFFNSQQTKESAFRKENLLKLKSLLKTNEKLLFGAIYKDFRKSEFDTFVNELNLIYLEIDYFLKNLNRLSRPKKVKTDLALLPGKSFYSRIRHLFLWYSSGNHLINRRNKLIKSFTL